MMGASAIIGAAVKGLSLIADLFTKIAPMIAAWMAAKKDAKADRLERVSKVKDEQLKIASRPPVSRSELLERMRRNKPSRSD